MEKHLLQPSILTRERKFIVDSGASMHMMSKMVLSPENVETVRVSRLPTTVITANVSIDTTEKGPSLRERFGHIRHGPITSRHSRSAKSGKLCEEGGYSYERTPCLSSFLVCQVMQPYRGGDSAESIKELTPHEQETTLASRDRLEDLPEWLEEFTEHLVEPRSTSS